jgi:hypothetical protein
MTQERDIFKEVQLEVERLKAHNQEPVAVAMAFTYFESEEVEAAFIHHNYEADYARAKLRPTMPLSLLGLPLCFNYGAVPKGFKWGIASKPAEW